MASFNPTSITLSAIQGAGLIALQEGAFGLSSRRPIRQIVWAPSGGTTNAIQSEGRAILTQRGFALTPEVVVEEHHHDDMIITQHPVESGASITDHAFKLPAEVSIRAGWSDGGQHKQIGQASLSRLLSSAQLTNIVPNLADPAYLSAIYARLLDLQVNRKFLQVVTGKRIYSNMLLQSLSVVTDQETEFALLVEIRLREVIVVSTRTITVSDPSVQQIASRTASPINAGTKSGIEVEPLPPPPGVASSDITTQRIAGVGTR